MARQKHDSWLSTDMMFQGTLLGSGNPTPGQVRWIRQGIAAVDSSANTVPLNTWTHVAYTVTDNSTVTIYLNGFNAGSAAWSFGTDTASVLTIGSVPSALPAWSFNGYLDDVRLYNRSLSADDILALRNLVPRRGTVLLIR
ncbi:MAG: LamG domain-containing protein [Lentisphaerae bacterium]|nr:LamG domain-containing protein [Lentisphaerota bacterium]